MKTPNLLLKISVVALALGLAALIWAEFGSRPTGAADHRDRRGFGLVSLNPGEVARLNIFSLNINEGTRADSEEARPSRIRLAFDVYARQPDAGNGSETCASRLRLVTRRTCEIVVARGEAVTWEFTAPPEGAVIRAVVNPDAYDPHIISSLELIEGGRTAQVINPNVIDR